LNIFALLVVEEVIHSMAVAVLAAFCLARFYFLQARRYRCQLGQEVTLVVTQVEAQAPRALAVSSGVSLR
jgi:hypothetical protein